MSFSKTKSSCLYTLETGTKIKETHNCSFSIMFTFCFSFLILIKTWQSFNPEVLPLNLLKHVGSSSQEWRCPSVLLQRKSTSSPDWWIIKDTAIVYIRLFRHVTTLLIKNPVLTSTAAFCLQASGNSSQVETWRSEAFQSRAFCSDGMFPNTQRLFWGNSDTSKSKWNALSQSVLVWKQMIKKVFIWSELYCKIWTL